MDTQAVSIHVLFQKNDLAVDVETTFSWSRQKRIFFALFLAMTEWQATGNPITNFGICSTMFLTWHLAHASVGVLLDFILKSSNGKLAKQAPRKLLSVWLNYVNFVE